MQGRHMEEKKLSVEVVKKTSTTQVQRIEAELANKLDASLPLGDQSRMMEAHDNWSELRFLGHCPDRRSYHSSFIHNRKYHLTNLSF